MTLAHELGHGVHQVLAAPQGYLMADTPLTLAETARVFGEMLTFRALLGARPTRSGAASCWPRKVEDMLNTVVRQIAFFEFETPRARRAAARRADARPHRRDLAARCSARASGPAFEFEAEYRWFWTYIPHFIHTPFYVYAYAFGDCLVNSLYAVYPGRGIQGFAEKYLDMLRAGGTQAAQGAAGAVRPRRVATRRSGRRAWT